jgi:phenylacetate-CoA ligase
VPDLDALLRAQLDYMSESSPLYGERINGAVKTVADLPRLPFLTKEDLRESQRARPPFGLHLCAPETRLVRMHVTSGTTGDPVIIGLTHADHEANSAVGAEAFRIAGVRRDHVIAHCLNYALYAGGIADHMALEASGGTVVPVGVGQSRRLVDLIPRLGITALFGTLSFPAHLAHRAREAGADPRALGLRRIVTAGEPGAGLAAVRREIEDAWGVPVADTFGMSDVWSTMAAECGAAPGLHVTTGDHAILEVVDPVSGDALGLEDGVEGELVWTHLRREASPLLRYRSRDLATVWTRPCPCGRDTPRILIHGRADDMLRIKAVNVFPSAIGVLLGGHPELGRWAVVAEGDPIAHLRVHVEAPPGADLAAVAQELRRELGATFELVRVPIGGMPLGELKTRVVYRVPADELPDVLSTRGGSA